MLKKNDIIRVNQLKGRRARVISQNGGRVGWVSLHSDQGQPFLERYEHTHIKFTTKSVIKADVIFNSRSLLI